MNTPRNSQASPRPARIPVPLSTIEERLTDHLGFLRRSIAQYDAGDTAEFRRMAVSLRVLLHNNPPKSHSVLKQVGMETIPFLSYSTPINPRNLIAEFSLAIMEMGARGTTLLPTLGRGPFPPKTVDLATWKSEAVLRDAQRHEFCRWDIIRAVADQDGGAHVDPSIDENYHRLANENSIGWVQVGPDGEKPIRHIEKAYIRHMAWEALTSIDTAWQKVLGNRPCGCGSGRKHRYCCGRARA